MSNRVSVKKLLESLISTARTGYQNALPPDDSTSCSPRTRYFTVL